MKLDREFSLRENADKTVCDLQLKLNTLLNDCAEKDEKLEFLKEEIKKAEANLTKQIKMTEDIKVEREKVNSKCAVLELLRSEANAKFNILREKNQELISNLKTEEASRQLKLNEISVLQEKLMVFFRFSFYPMSKQMCIKMFSRGK